jgi:hypothetical protein
MGKKAIKKQASDVDMKQDEVLVDKFLMEMDELLHKYPQDPNQMDVNEKKLEKLIADLDKNWMSFKRRWKNRLAVEKVIGSGMVENDAKGIRHLVIRSEAGQDSLVDLVVEDKSISAR